MVQILSFPLNLNAYTPFELSDSNTPSVFGFKSAESAIGFGGRLQRHQSTGLFSSGVVFDPHRPYQDFLLIHRDKNARGQ
jgi:hypothetical protein